MTDRMEPTIEQQIADDLKRYAAGVAPALRAMELYRTEFWGRPSAELRNVPTEDQGQ